MSRASDAEAACAASENGSLHFVARRGGAVCVRILVSILFYPGRILYDYYLLQIGDGTHLYEFIGTDLVLEAVRVLQLASHHPRQRKPNHL